MAANPETASPLAACPKRHNPARGRTVRPPESPAGRRRAGRDAGPGTRGGWPHPVPPAPSGRRADRRRRGRFSLLSAGSGRSRGPAEAPVASRRPPRCAHRERSGRFRRSMSRERPASCSPVSVPGPGRRAAAPHAMGEQGRRSRRVRIGCAGFPPCPAGRRGYPPYAQLEPNEWHGPSRPADRGAERCRGSCVGPPPGTCGRRFRRSRRPSAAPAEPRRRWRTSRSDAVRGAACAANPGRRPARGRIPATAHGFRPG